MKIYVVLPIFVLFFFILNKPLYSQTINTWEEQDFPETQDHVGHTEYTFHGTTADFCYWTINDETTFILTSKVGSFDDYTIGNFILYDKHWKEVLNALFYIKPNPVYPHTAEVDKGTVKKIVDYIETEEGYIAFIINVADDKEQLFVLKTQADTSSKYTEKSSIKGIENNHQWVDLGLSVKWATTNIGGSSSEDSGDYFAWGEVKPKTDYNEVNYFDAAQGENSFKDEIELDNKDEFKEETSFPIFNHVRGYIRITPNSGYDAARVNWGGSWRMPTLEEFEELIEKCKFVWKSNKGVEGFEVFGPNGQSIFLPASGFMGGKDLFGKGEKGYYLTNALGNKSYACSHLSFSSSIKYLTGFYRNWGYTIRPVMD